MLHRNTITKKAADTGERSQPATLRAKNARSRVLMRALVVLTVLITVMCTLGASVIGIDDDTVITVEQAGSIAPSSGDYGWDSRGAVVAYESLDGRVRGSLGTVWFEDTDGSRRNFMWDKWGKKFPDSWNRRIADMIVKNTAETWVGKVREAFAGSMRISCTWIIAIGTKSSKAGGELYKTLRTDNTLRVAYNKDLAQVNPPERMFIGDEMRGSLAAILPGQMWGSGTLATFAERNPYEYSIKINSYDVKVYATNCVACARMGLRAKGGDCPHVKQGTYFCAEVPIVRGDNEYSGTKSFAWEGQTVSYAARTYPGYVRKPSADDASQVRGLLNGQQITPYADSTLYLAYEAAGGSNTPGPEPGGGTPSGGGGAAYIGESHAYDTYPMTGAVIDSHFFNVPYAIPSTEDLFVNITAKNYLYDFDASVVSGQYPLAVDVIFPYELRWTETVMTDDAVEENKTDFETDEADGHAATEVIEHVETGSETVSVVIYRDYSYVHLNSFAYYGLLGATVSNPAMNPRTVNITSADAGVYVPSCSYPTVYGSTSPRVNENIAYPYDYTGSIVAPTLVIEGGDAQPSVPYSLYAEAVLVAESGTGQLLCRNDELFFGGRNACGSTGWHAYAGTVSADTSVFGSFMCTLNSERVYGARYLSIPASVRNGTYYSDGQITYSPLVLYGLGGIDYDGVLYVNAVSVHTPIVCDIEITDCDLANPNSMYLEEIGVKPDSYDMILNVGRSDSEGAYGHENDGSDFFITVSNRGTHGVYAGILGSSYDYLFNRSGRNGGSYVATDEVMFPFDVYVDRGILFDERDDELISAGTWLNLRNTRERMYLPEWVREGDYTIEARTRAVNYRTADTLVSTYANNSLECYIATDTITVHVSGRMFGLRLSDVSSEAEWKEVFVGKRWGDICYRVGLKNELGLSLGLGDKYILPLVDGAHPNPERINTGMLKSGYVWTFDLDTTGSKMAEMGAYVRIVPIFHGLDGAVLDLYYDETFVGRGHDDVLIGSVLDTSNVKSFGELGRYSYSEILLCKPLDVTDGRQHWRFKYSLPTVLKLRKKSGEQAEDLFAVKFLITAYDAKGEAYLSYYSEESVCNMWNIEDQQLHRTDYFGNTYEFEYGDVLLLDAGKNKAGDYVIDRRY